MHPAVILLVPLVLLVCLAPWLVRRGRAGLRTLIGASRLSRGHCPKCDYGFAGGLRDHCVDCGHKLTKAEFERLSRVWEVLQRTEMKDK